MNHSGRKLRRADALVAHRHHIVAALGRTMMVMLPIWLGYFFAVSLFARNLNAIEVPYLNMPVATYLVIQGSAVVFTITLYLLARAFGAAGRP